MNTNPFRSNLPKSNNNPFTFIELINAEYDVVSFVVNCLLLLLLPFVSMMMIFSINRFFPAILSARGANDDDAKIN